MKYTRLGVSEVGSFLEKLDRKLNPDDGLFRWRNGALEKMESRPPAERPMLLIVHGTFSSGRRVLADFETDYGRAFLDRMALQYEIVTFEHPTLSVSPMLNALRLARLLTGFPNSIDIITHSRGGLVVRWWLEVFDPKPAAPRRAILVAAPLRGTSLAAPDRLRHGIELLTNLGELFGDAAHLIPFLTVAVGLLRVALSLGKVAAHTPVLDVGVAAIPGLAAMSRIRNHFELNQLNSPDFAPAGPDYYAVISDFEPPPNGWRFWRNFADYKTRLANLATDQIIFDGKNDLVVDTASMLELAAGPLVSTSAALRIYDFGTSQVHHTRYFRERKTIDFLASTLQPKNIV